LLFGTKRPAITKHLCNIFKFGELEEKEVSSILEHTTIHGAIKGKKLYAFSKMEMPAEELLKNKLSRPFMGAGFSTTRIKAIKPDFIDNQLQ
jgi:hypothetical protein